MVSDGMKKKIEEHMANLISIGVTKAQLAEKGYEYALALQDDELPEGGQVTAAMMARAADLVREALPGAYRIYELRMRIR